MTWSTRELAELAGTTVNTIRHYHSLGLLDAPERTFNGYKQYRVPHLVRLLQVRRIAELGLPLAQVEAAGGADGELLDDLRQREADTALEIERLHRTRSDIAAILSVDAPADTPRGFEAIASDLSQADRSLIHILTKLSGETEAAGLREVVAAEPVRIRGAFDALHPDSGEAVRSRVAERMSAEAINWRSAERPWLSDESRRQGRRARVVTETIVEALNELYNAAQRDVLDRIAAGVSEAPRRQSSSETAAPVCRAPGDIHTAQRDPSLGSFRSTR